MLRSSETHFNLSKDDLACFHGQHFSFLEGIQKTTSSACLCNYFERNYYPKRVIKRQKKVKIQCYESRGKSYPVIKLIHIMLTDSLRHRMDKCKSFVFARQYRNCCCYRDNQIFLRNVTSETCSKT